MIVIGIAGGSGSGKTALVEGLVRSLRNDLVCNLSMDYYYKDNSQFSPEERRKINFDHPDSIDYNLLVSDINQLRSGLPISHPLYSFHTNTRLTEKRVMLPGKILLLEGILIFNDTELSKLFDLKFFIDAPSGTRLNRIINRDISERGRSLEEATDHILKDVFPMHELFVEPSKKIANVILDGTRDLKLIVAETTMIIKEYICKD